MIRAGSASLLLACCLILGLLGPLEPVTTDLCAGVAVAAWLGCRRPVRIALWAALPAIPIVLGIEDPCLRLAALGLLSFVIPAVRGRPDTGFIASVLGWRLLWEAIPWLAVLEVEFSRVFSGAIGAATGQRLDFGPAAAGLDIFIIFLLRAACGHAVTADWSHRRFILSVATLVVYIAIVPSAAASRHVVPLDQFGLFNMANEHLAPGPGALARLIFGWLPVLFAALCLAWLPDRIEQARARRFSLPTRVAVPILCVALPVFQWHGDRRTEGRRPGEIVILKTATFDMAVAAAGQFGAGRAGMFGMLPRYLALDGHRTLVHEGLVTPALLARTSLLVVILPPVPFAGQEVAAIEQYVAGGGSLLALGDHTDLLGTMAPMNRLLKPFGMALKFDSAFPAVREWRASVSGPGLSGRSFTGIGTGASIQTWGATRPVVIGRYAHSDAGDRKNTGRGAYLGDYSYQPGEQLSDIILAAEATYGLGRVVAFGDTSSFQNLMLPRSYPFVAGLIDDLTRPAPSTRHLSSLCAGLVAGTLGLLALAGSATSCGGLAAAILMAGLVLPGDGRHESPFMRLPADAPVALIDSRHLNRFSREFWRDDSIGGFLVSLQREGFLPFLSDEAEATRPLYPGHLPVLIAPRTVLGRLETDRLVRHLAGGGDILVAAGAAEYFSVEPLLSLFGLSIGRMPLGPVPIRPDLEPAAVEQVRKEPQFREAYPLVHDGRLPIRSYYSAFDRPIVACLKVDEGAARPGRLLVIADPAFLTDRVLENETTAWEGNVALLGGLLHGDRDR